jgi:hypothetical protein
MRSPEGWEKVEIKQYLDSVPMCWYFSPSMTGYGKGGIPDIVGCYRGRLFSIEVKREDRIPTKLQNQRMWEIAQSGGKVFWGVSNKVIAEFELWKQLVANRQVGTIMDIDSDVAG